MKIAPSTRLAFVIFALPAALHAYEQFVNSDGILSLALLFTPLWSGLIFAPATMVAAWLAMRRFGST